MGTFKVIENPIYDQLKQEIVSVFGMLVYELKKREKNLIDEVESLKKPINKNVENFKPQISEINSAEINYFCDLSESIIK